MTHLEWYRWLRDRLIEQYGRDVVYKDRTFRMAVIDQISFLERREAIRRGELSWPEMPCALGRRPK